MRTFGHDGLARLVYLLRGGSVSVGMNRTSTVGSFDGGGEGEETN